MNESIMPGPVETWPIDVNRVQLDPEAHTPGGFRRDQRGARAHEGFKQDRKSVV